MSTLYNKPLTDQWLDRIMYIHENEGTIPYYVVSLVHEVKRSRAEKLNNSSEPTVIMSNN